MSLKTYLLSSSIGATGTTTIAIPSAYAYGNGLVKSDPKIKEIRDKNEGLKNEKLKLEKQTSEANEAAEKAKSEKQTIDKQNEVLKTEHQKLNSQYEAQKKSADNWATKASSVSESANEISNKNKALIGEKVTLSNENEKLQTQLNKKNNEVSAESKGLPQRVANHLKEILDKLSQSGDHDSLINYSQLKEWTRGGTNKPQDVKNYKWHCKEHRWTKSNSTQRGLAYCVLKEKPNQASSSQATYTTHGRGVNWDGSGDWGPPPPFA